MIPHTCFLKYIAYLHTTLRPSCSLGDHLQTCMLQASSTMLACCHSAAGQFVPTNLHRPCSSQFQPNRLLISLFSLLALWPLLSIWAAQCCQPMRPAYLDASQPYYSPTTSCYPLFYPLPPVFATMLGLVVVPASAVPLLSCYWQGLLHSVLTETTGRWSYYFFQNLEHMEEKRSLHFLVQLS